MRWFVQFLTLALMACTSVARAYTICVDTFVCNAAADVAVPVTIDTAAGLSFVSVRLAYDPQILTLNAVEPGTLNAVMADDFTVSTNELGCVTVGMFGTSNVVEAAGSIAVLHFKAHENTERLYSDITIAEIQMGEMDGVKDVTVGNPVQIENGMVRIMSDGAAVARLENAQTVMAGTRLASLSLNDGDAIQASSDQTAIVLSGSVTSKAATIPVRAPIGGWSNGQYVLLKTTTPGLVLALDDVAGATVSYSNATVSGVTTYYVNVTLAGELMVVCDDEDEPLDSIRIGLIRDNARLAFDGKSDADALVKQSLYNAAKKLKVSGPKGLVSTIADMGISPMFAPALDDTGTLQLTYAKPTLEITGFNPATGVVRFKVTPGEGNEIVSTMAKSYLHVYGTDKLGDPMRFVSSVDVDLTPYLNADTKGEGVAIVDMGSHTFLKVKVESAAKTNGETE